MRKRSFAFILSLLIIHCSFAQWEWQYPVPQGNTLNDMTFLDSYAKGYAVGNYGSLISTTDRGTSWNFIDSLTTKNLRSVRFFNQNLGYITGDSGLILRYANNTWTESPTGSFYQLRNIDYASENNWVAVGYKGLILKSNGDAWEEITSGTLKTLHSISFGSDQTGVIVGEDGIVLRTNDGGITWVKVSAPVSVPIYDVYMPTATTGYAVGKGGIILKTTDGGSTWTNISLSVIEDDLFGVYFRDDQTGSVCGENGIVMNTFNGGSNWKFEGLYVPLKLDAVYSFQSANDTMDCDTVMACGANGAMVNIFTGGCDTLDYEYAIGTHMTLNSIAFNNNTGFAVGGDPYVSQPLILSSADGQTWSPLVIDTIKQYLSDICLVNDTVGYISGYNGKIYRTLDGGNNWYPLVTDVSNRLTAITADFGNDTLVTGWAVGFFGTLLRSTNVDTLWQKVDININEHLFGIGFYSPWKGFAVGENGTLLKINSNINTFTVTQVNTGVTAALYDVAFPTDSTAFIVGFNGKIFKYNFNKKDKALIPIASGVTNPLNRIFFTDPDTGYIVGEGGLVLKTTNGGMKWLPLNTRTSSNLRGIWFTGSGTGYIAGSGASILYTENGGGPVILPGVAEKEETEKLVKVFPNPNNGNFGIAFKIAVSDHVKASLYDLSGNPVKDLIDRKMSPGQHQVQIPPLNLKRGVYVLVIRIGQNTITEKIVVMD